MEPGSARSCSRTSSSSSIGPSGIVTARRRPGLKLDPLDPEPVATPFGGQAADLGHESLGVGVQPAVQRGRAVETHADSQHGVGVELGCEQAIEHLGRATQYVRLGLELRDIDTTTLPPHLVQSMEDDARSV